LPNAVHAARRLTAALILATALAHAQSKPAPIVPVLMLSDIHLDPFADPAKVAQLRTAPVAQWHAILTSADTPTIAADFATLQRTCRAKGIDTPMPLLTSSLAAEQKELPHPLFVTVSGDLMAHQFDCKFKTLARGSTEADYSAFAAKTVAFVALELKQTFPGTPIYFALGNNDSGCKDYAEDTNSTFLQGDAQTFATDAQNPIISQQFSQLGDYNIELPAPFEHKRLIVLQDIFESKKFTTCDGTPDKSATSKQIEWLRTQLAAAKAKGEHVWVMAHIPPGIDAYSTFTKGASVCTNGDPTLFLNSSALGDTLVDYASTISLGLFGHTHMDEMKLLHNAAGQSVPIKLVPSITPVNGNNPAFTIAKVDPHTATLVDYTVISASNKTGIATTWTKEYTYSSTYKQPDYSSASVNKLMVDFTTDKAGTNPLSQSYQTFYFAGSAELGVSANLKAAAMQLIWHGYACSMTEMDPTTFRTCACPAKP
jgi:sphingomyelin phosphodiesterase acid-like 3